MSSWKKVRLGDYIHEYSKRNKDNANIPVYSVTNINGFCTEYFSKEVASKDKTTYKIVNKGFFAYNPSRINVGSVDWLRDMDRVIVSPLYNVFFVDDTLDQQYLYYYLKSPVGLFYINELASGSVRDNLKFSILSEFNIPFPDLTIQKDIAITIDRIVQTINICNKILKKIDSLVKSRFVEMFGDPVKNTKHIKTKRGIEIFKLSNGKAVPVEKRFDQGIPAYGGNGISWYTNEILAEQDTLVIGRVGFQSGNVHFARAPLWITDNAMYISSLDNKCYDIIFLCALMEHIDFTRYQDAGDLKKITQKPFMNTEFIAPPIEMQKKYVSFVEQTDKSKYCLVGEQILGKAEMLIELLNQEYFG